MLKIPVYEYYKFGFNYYVLRECNPCISNQGLLERLEDFFNFVDELKLDVTRSGIKTNELEIDYEMLKEASLLENTREQSVDSFLLARIKSKIERIDSILDAELHIKIGYMLEEKRYSTHKLLEKVETLFAESVYVHLPEIAQFDFKECGLCLAFDRYTASAFHALRATEDVLKMYHSKLLKPKPRENRTWGNFVNEIKNKIDTDMLDPIPPEELMINLENIRKYYRNKTQHPKLTYSSDEAQDLFNLCVKTTNEMIKDLQRRELL